MRYALLYLGFDQKGAMLMYPIRDVVSFLEEKGVSAKEITAIRLRAKSRTNIRGILYSGSLGFVVGNGGLAAEFAMRAMDTALEELSAK